MFLPQGGLSSERTVIYLSALRKLAFKQKQIKKITKDSKSPGHRSGVFTVFVHHFKERGCPQLSLNSCLAFVLKDKTAKSA